MCTALTPSSYIHERAPYPATRHPWWSWRRQVAGIACKGLILASCRGRLPGGNATRSRAVGLLLVDTFSSVMAVRASPDQDVAGYLASPSERHRARVVSGALPTRRGR
jgi:hypothetical protein